MNTCCTTLAASGETRRTSSRIDTTPPPGITPAEALLGLLTELDKTHSDAQAFPLILAAVTAMIPCDQAFLYEWDDLAGQPRLRNSASTDAAFMNDYLSRFRSIDPFATEAVQVMSIDTGRSILSQEILTPENLATTPFHARFLARRGDLRHGLGLYLRSSVHHRIRIWLFRNAQGPAFSDAERSHLELFRQHVAPKWRQRRRLARLERERDASLACIDNWNQPLLVLDENAQLLCANACAESVLREGRRLRRDGNQVVAGRHVDHASWMRDTIADLNRDTRHSQASGARCLSLMGRRDTKPRHFGLMVSQPTRSGSRMLFTAILIDLEQAPPRHSVNDLMGMFGFTPSEARVANALISGLTTETVSQAFLIRRDTVRTHVKRLLDKTGTHSHAELQKVLLRLSPNLTALSRRGD